MKIGVVRGRYITQFEMQSFEPLAGRHEVVGFSSLRPIHNKFAFPIIKIPSPMDLPNFPSQRIKLGVLNRIFVDAHYLLGLEEKLKGFDIAHTCETYFHYTQQCLNAKKKGYVKKVVATVWENIPFNNEGICGRKKFKKRAIEELDHFIAPTEQVKEALLKEGCQEEKITVIPMGIDFGKFKVKSSKLKVEDKNLEILFVGRLIEEKGIVELLEAFRLLCNQLPGSGLRLRIIGNGPFNEYIVRRGREWGIGDRITVEQKSYTQMPDVYQNADIFVLPSKPAKYWLEQFGFVLLEAMVSGLPIVSTKSGAIPEVVDDIGILVSPADSQALYYGLLRLVKDPSLRQKLGRKGRLRAEKYFNAQKTAEKIERLYNLL